MYTIDCICFRQTILISYKLCVQKFQMITFPQLLSYRRCLLPIQHYHFFFILAIIFAILRNSNFLPYLQPTSKFISLSASHLVCKTTLLAFHFASMYFSIFLFPYLNSLQSSPFSSTLLLTSLL